MDLLHFTSPTDLALRLLCAFAAAFVIGLDRGEHGHTVGLRTTLLVTLAACLAMLQASALIALTGKAPDSFVQTDVMRLPLGILSGIGFIGGGAILRRDNMVAGVTTAATLWFVTVIGLCFGGGQFLIGWSGTGVGLFVLAGLRGLDRAIPREELGTLKVHVDGEVSSVEQLRQTLHHAIEADRMRVESLKVSELVATHRTELEWKLAWKAAGGAAGQIPRFIGELRRSNGVAFIAWEPQTGH